MTSLSHNITFFLSLIIAFLCNTVSAKDVDAVYSIPFTNQSGLIVIEGSCNGESGYFIFDSGADAVILNSDIYNTDTLSAASTTEFQTLSGKINALSTTVSALNIGGYVFENEPAYLSSLEHLNGLAQGNLLGIIGASFFTSEIIHIDNLNKVIQLYSRDSKSRFTAGKRTITTNIEIKDDLIYVPLKIGEEEHLFMLDTGASVSMLDSRFHAKYSESFELASHSFEYVTADVEKMDSEIYQAPDVLISNLRVKEFQFGIASFTALADKTPVNFAGILSIEQLPVSELLLDIESQMLYLIL